MTIKNKQTNKQKFSASGAVVSSSRSGTGRTAAVVLGSGSRRALAEAGTWSTAVGSWRRWERAVMWWPSRVGRMWCRRSRLWLWVWLWLLGRWAVRGPLRSGRWADRSAVAFDLGTGVGCSRAVGIGCIAGTAVELRPLKCTNIKWLEKHSW